LNPVNYQELPEFSPEILQNEIEQRQQLGKLAYYHCTTPAKSVPRMTGIMPQTDLLRKSAPESVRPGPAPMLTMRVLSETLSS
jgi:hypothetical protein